MNVLEFRFQIEILGIEDEIQWYHKSPDTEFLIFTDRLSGNSLGKL